MFFNYLCGEMAVEKKIKKWPLWGFVLVVAAAYGITVIGSEFIGVPVSGAYSILTTGSQWALIALCATGLFAVLSLSRVLFAFAFPLIMTLSGAMMYLLLAAGIRLTPTSVEIAIVNDAAMWWSMTSPGLVISILAGLGLGIFAVWIRWKHVRYTNLEKWILGIAGGILTLLPFTVKRLEAPVGSRLPYSIYFAPRQFFANRHVFLTQRNTFDNETPIVESSRPTPDIIFIIGEALRADHLPQNGYARNTMPNLSRDTAAISLPHIYSEATYTHASVPMIMTRADSAHTDRRYEEQSFITLFKKAGFRTAWITNQDLGISYTYFAHEADTLVYCATSASLYDYEKWLDTATLPFIKELFDSKSEESLLAVVHTIGSHWWYKSHYTERHARFKPEVNHKDVAGLTREQMVNSYDNTIIATDEFLALVFDIVRDRNCVVIYISDHGEALGEEGVYLHGTAVEPLHHPACIVWYSPKYAATYPEKVRALRNGKLLPRRTDAMFHSALDAAGIVTHSLDTTQSIFRYETADMD